MELNINNHNYCQFIVSILTKIKLTSYFKIFGQYQPILADNTKFKVYLLWNLIKCYVETYRTWLSGTTSNSLGLYLFFFMLSNIVLPYFNWYHWQHLMINMRTVTILLLSSTFSPHHHHSPHHIHLHLHPPHLLYSCLLMVRLVFYVE